MAMHTDRPGNGNVSEGAVNVHMDAALNREEGFTILLVDDEVGVLKALRRLFLETEYTILTAGDGKEALAVMERQPVHLVISDHRMPGMSGAELLGEIRLRWPETIRIMLTGYADVQYIMEDVHKGSVYKFITKPWNDEDLKLTVGLALRHYVLERENRELKEITKAQQAKIRKYSATIDEHRGVLGSYLVRSGEISPEQLDRAARERRDSELLGETLVRLGFTTESMIVKVLEDFLKLEYADLGSIGLNPNVARFLPLDLCERNRLLPIRLESKQITIAMADPSDILKCDNIELMTCLRVVPVIARPSDILAQLKKIHGEQEPDTGKGIPEPVVSRTPSEFDVILEEGEEADFQGLVGSSEVPPVIKLVNAIISEAIRHKASDIHIEPTPEYTVVRYRICGMLYGKIKIPAEFHQATISRIKILAKMDIAERSVPQEGVIVVRSGTRRLDVKAFTMPGAHGEKVVMQVRDEAAGIKGIEDMGLADAYLAKINALITKPQGIIIAGGPPASGKNTMLYAILNTMLQNAKKHRAGDDQAEYFLEESNQVLVRRKKEFALSSVLRVVLRQDPDVMLVGGLDDPEAADVAFKAALTGHMVMGTMDVASAAAAVGKLLDMGVRPYLLASAVEAVMNQRLVRRICPHCRIKIPPDKKMLRSLGLDAEAVGGTAYKGRGCAQCDNSGYAGQIGLHELVVMDDFMRNCISGNYDEAELLQLARAAGMRTLMEDGVQKVQAGQTTLEELLMVLGATAGEQQRCASCRETVDSGFAFCPHCGAKSGTAA